MVFGLLEELYSLSNKAISAKFSRVSTPGVRSGGERTSEQEPHDQERAEKENNNFSSEDYHGSMFSHLKHICNCLSCCIFRDYNCSEVAVIFQHFKMKVMFKGHFQMIHTLKVM